MRSAVSSAIYIFLVTFQLTNFTQGAIPNLVKASRSTAGEITEASESAYYVGQVTSSAKELVYWTPPPTNPLVIEQLAEHQPKIFSSAAGASSSKNPFSASLKVFKGKREKSLKEEQLNSQHFINEMLKLDTPPEYQQHLINYGFQKFLEKPNLFAEEPNLSKTEGEKWLATLEQALQMTKGKRIPDADREIATSALYGLTSIHLRFLRHYGQRIQITRQEDLKLLQKANSMAANIRKTYFGIQGEDEAKLPTFTWQKEILNPSDGFSDGLAAKKSLQELIKHDRDLSNAMSDRIEVSMKATKILQQSFQDYLAPKRVAILAILRYQMSHTSREVERPEDFVKALVNLANSRSLLPHEVKLLEKVQEARRVKSSATLAASNHPQL
ncbi:hypothetical protein PCANC_05663 [Puccinia coronata f. sp. avenae]|uniref:Uncharacterized protein n=1 Tax=Puccinia coronata f. sp. avenae TaxID=200324 RepID=A0A2N5T3W3_9BASI|nr:hypothetical protein PCANC_09840 [Puccinia coronata f. sp. avenae]PLW34442.1 hypothetical protein PCASD_15172 [Puccinia coronata f. sp. avenae]PLW54837.1 hypothetical protein PCANC_05663 [Puccinia coronata f. sp. avenae]